MGDITFSPLTIDTSLFIILYWGVYLTIFLSLYILYILYYIYYLVTVPLSVDPTPGRVDYRRTHSVRSTLVIQRNHSRRSRIIAKLWYKQDSGLLGPRVILSCEALASRNTSPTSSRSAELRTLRPFALATLSTFGHTRARTTYPVSNLHREFHLIYFRRSVDHYFEYVSLFSASIIFYLFPLSSLDTIFLIIIIPIYLFIFSLFSLLSRISFPVCLYFYFISRSLSLQLHPAKIYIFLYV